MQVYSNLPLETFHFEHFRLFCPSAMKMDFQVAFHLVYTKDLTGIPLEPEENPLLFKAGRRGTCSKLLRSEQVLARLEEAKAHTDQLIIEMHPVSMSILDFYESRADFFYSVRSASSFKKRMIGPAILAPFLPNFNALMLHASAIVRHGRAAVFLAPDEGGKTTAACLSPAGTILGDDQVIVRKVRKRFRVWGTPWGLHVSAGTQAPLAGLFLLKKADHFSLQPLLARDLVPRIWEEIKNPLSILPKPLKKKAFGILCDIAAAAPSWILSFPRNRIDWKAIDQALATASIHDGQRVTGKRRETFGMEIDV